MATAAAVAAAAAAAAVRLAPRGRLAPPDPRTHHGGRRGNINTNRWLFRGLQLARTLGAAAVAQAAAAAAAVGAVVRPLLLPG